MISLGKFAAALFFTSAAAQSEPITEDAVFDAEVLSAPLPDEVLNAEGEQEEAAPYAGCDEKRFMEWVDKYGMQFYSVEEFETRYKYWCETDYEIWELNASQDSSARWGHNALSALSPEEKKALLGAEPDEQDHCTDC